MKKVLVLYGGLNERVNFVKQSRGFFDGSISNVKTYFDNEERFSLKDCDIDEFSYFAGIVNLAMQRNPQVILLHEIKSVQTIEKLMELFDAEFYTVFIGKNTSQKHDISISTEGDTQEQIKNIFEKLIS